MDGLCMLGWFIPVALEVAALLAAFIPRNFRNPRNHLLRLSSWGGDLRYWS